VSCVQGGRYRRRMSIARNPSGSCSGRAVSIRCGDAVTDPGKALRDAGRDGVTILIVSPSCWASPGLATALAAGRGFQAMISAGFSNIVLNNLIKMAILPVSLMPAAVAKVADRVESDPDIVLRIDLGRGDVRAREEVLARFDIHSEPDLMARRLLMAQRLLRSASLPTDVKMRLQRRLLAICDAMKAPGADNERSAWRLDLLLTELSSIGQPTGNRARRTP
jgi:hypothetical protein